MFSPFTQTATLGDLLPFEDHTDDDIVLLRDNSLMAMFAVDGVCPDAADEVDIVGWFEMWHNAQLNVAAEDVEFTVLRHRTELEPGALIPKQHSTALATAIDEAYCENLHRTGLHRISTCLAVQIHPPNVVIRGFSKLVADPMLDGTEALENRASRLSEICHMLEAQMPTYGLRRLGYVRRDNPALFDRIAEDLVLATTGVPRQIGATTGRMGNAMFSEDVHFRRRVRRRHIEIEGAGDPTYAALFAFKEYPRATWPGMLKALDVAPYRSTVAQSFRFLSNSAADGVLTRKQNKRLIAGDKSHSQTQLLDTAYDEFLDRKWVLGDHSLVVAAFAGSRRELTTVSHATWRDLAQCGLVATRINHTIRAAWLSMLPGMAHLRPRPGYVSSRNFVAFAPLYNWPLGETKGRWGDDPIATFRTLGGTPYHFHWHVLDNGNTFVTGASGSGKTTGMGFLGTMSASRARVIVLDHKRGQKFLVRRLGGDYAELGGAPHFNPLKGLDARQINIEFLIELARAMVGVEMTAEEERRCALGIRTVMECLPPAERSWAEVRAFFDSAPEGAGARLEKWLWPTGELGWVLDAPRDTVRFGDVSGLDTTRLLEHPRASGPAMAYLFHRIDLLLDGSPTLIICDEGWRALIDPYFKGHIARHMRTDRSKNAVFVFITQSPGDINDSDIANVLTEQCPTQFHFANPRAYAGEEGGEDYKKIGLTAGQRKAHRALQPGQGLALLKQGDRAIVVQLKLDGMDEFLPLLSAPESALTLAAREEEYAEAAE